MPFDHYSDTLKNLHEKIFELDAQDEQIVINRLMQEAALDGVQLQKTKDLARQLANGVRTARLNAGSIDLLTQEFSLDSQEGVALMCMAEAMLRVPDTETRNKLIRDKVVGQDWHSHIGKSTSMFVNATAWGLTLTGKLLKEPDEKSLANALTSVLRRGGEGAVRSGVAFAMKLLGKQFVTGQTIEEAIETATPREKIGYRYSYDMLGEAALTPEDAEAYYQSYAHTIDRVGQAAKGQGPIDGAGVSVKLTGLHPRYEIAQYQRVDEEMYPRLLALAKKAKKYNIGFHLDQEEVARFPLTLEMLTRLAFEPDLQGWDGLGISLQAYQKRGRAVVDYIVGLSQETGHRILVRLVKGAYWDTEIKRCQSLGTDTYPVFTRKVHSDVSYLACAKALLAAQKEIFPQFATHNAFSIAAAYTLGEGKEYEFQCLHGMGESVYDQVVGSGKLNKACRVYAPVGPYETLLAYLVRRLIENGANTSFVNQVVDSSVSIDDIIADPVAQAGKSLGRPNPATPLPRNLLAWRTGAQTAGANGSLLSAATEGGQAPEDDGVVDAATVVELAATSGWQLWSQTPVSARVAALNTAARALEAGYLPLQQALASLRKFTMAESAEEQRWAADACRLNASLLAASGSLATAQPRGVVAVFSPNSSPLAWTVSYAAAALAAGNPVVIKTASGQEEVALAVKQLFSLAGVPEASFQVAQGRGEAIAPMLFAHPQLAAFAVGGARRTVDTVRQRLAAVAPKCQLFARASGNACMVVDSSALPEQVISDAIFSAFDFAGQRVNSLKLICLQDVVAGKMLGMLQAMLGERMLGDAADPTVDIGPLADAENAASFERYLEGLFAKGMRVTRHGRGIAGHVPGLVRPAIVELAGIEDLRHIDDSINGPVLHVLTWNAKDLALLLSGIDRLVQPSLLGLHTRIYETAGEVLSLSRAANLFVNRPVHISRVGMQVDAAGFHDHGVSAVGPTMLFNLCNPTGSEMNIHCGPFEKIPTKDLRQYLNYPVAINATLRDRATVEGAHIEERLTALRTLSSKAPTVLMQQAAATVRQYLSAVVSQLAAKEMPAFMGEENTLVFGPIGEVACTGSSRESLLIQVMTAVATGNRVVLAQGVDSPFYLEVLGQDRCRIVGDSMLLTQVDAVLSDTKRSTPGNLANVAAMVPLSSGLYPWWNLLSERNVTINSSASGDNTQLMAKDDEALAA